MDAHMKALTNRLEQSTGPDRELDGHIFETLGGAEWREAYRRVQEPCGCPHETAVHDAKDRFAPRYTASIDATVALVERCLPGWSWECRASGTGDRGQATVWNPSRAPGNNQEQRAYNCASPAIALLTALFRALEAQGADHG
jgi:hypothetical protein